MSFSGRVLVYGGKGALGSACVQHFKSKNWVSSSCSFEPLQTLQVLQILQTLKHSQKRSPLSNLNLWICWWSLIIKRSSFNELQSLIFFFIFFAQSNTMCSTFKQLKSKQKKSKNHSDNLRRSGLARSIWWRTRRQTLTLCCRAPAI